MENLSILGLFRWNPDIFNDMTIPDGVSRETLVNNLLSECAEFEILYPDPDFCKFAIDNWSAKMNDEWTKLAATTQLEYNPLSNFTVEETETGKNTTSPASTTTTTNSALPFDGTAFVDREKTVTQQGGSNVNDSVVTRKRSGMEGGVTAQSLIKKERDIARFDIYDEIIKDFKKRFCLLVY